MPHDDGGPHHRHRHTGVAQQVLDFPARAKMWRQVVVVSSKAAKIDDLSDTARRCRETERMSRFGVLALEVVVTERMDEVDRDVHTLKSAGKRAGFMDVTANRCAGTVVVIRTSRHGAHLVTLCEQHGNEPSTNEARRSGHQHSCHSLTIGFKPLFRSGEGVGSAGRGRDRRRATTLVLDPRIIDPALNLPASPSAIEDP